MSTLPICEASVVQIYLNWVIMLPRWILNTPLCYCLRHFHGCFFCVFNFVAILVYKFVQERVHLHLWVKLNHFIKLVLDASYFCRFVSDIYKSLPLCLPIFLLVTDSLGSWFKFDLKMSRSFLFLRAVTIQEKDETLLFLLKNAYLFLIELRLLPIVIFILGKQ